LRSMRSRIVWPTSSKTTHGRGDFDFICCYIPGDRKLSPTPRGLFMEGIYA
jgi:hypothetical protein